jgi:hypothetical protein
MTVLSSQWGGLSPHLLLTLCEVHIPPSGDWTRPETDYSVSVVAPITDGELEQTHNWNSPFESQTLDSSAGLHAFSAALQMGIGAKVANDLGKLLPPGPVSDLVSKFGASAGAVAGRTGITKLNSTQIYNGTPPLKMTLTLLFRALVDPVAEVKAPVAQLFAWAAPKRLAPYGLADLVTGQAGGSALRTVYPSEVPSMVSVMYGGSVYSPMVIESISKSMTSPIDRNGNPTFTTVQLSLSSLTALDRQDWVRALSGSSYSAPSPMDLLRSSGGRR